MKPTKKKTIRLGNKSKVVEVPIFTGNLVDYSGFGVHGNKIRNAERRDRKLEESRVKRGLYD